TDRPSILGPRCWAPELGSIRHPRLNPLAVYHKGPIRHYRPLAQFGVNLVSKPGDFSGFSRLGQLFSPFPSISYMFPASMAWKRSSVRSRPGPPNLSTPAHKRRVYLCAGAKFPEPKDRVFVPPASGTGIPTP